MSLTDELYSKLRETLYSHASEHGTTCFEAIGVLNHLANEASANALVDDGLLAPGPDRKPREVEPQE